MKQPQGESNQIDQSDHTIDVVQHLHAMDIDNIIEMIEKIDHTVSHDVDIVNAELKIGAQLR